MARLFGQYIRKLSGGIPAKFTCKPSGESPFPRFCDTLPATEKTQHISQHFLVARLNLSGRVEYLAGGFTHGHEGRGLDGAG